jgi:hypothetical protein
MDITISDGADLAAAYVRAEVDGVPAIVTVHGDPRAPDVRIEVWACRWVAGCTADATTLVTHPVLSQVPACDRHATQVQAHRAG